MSKTYREQFEDAMKCETPKEAEAWLERELGADYWEAGQSRDERLHVIRANLGYVAGYYGHDEALKVRRLFGAVHPIFGTANYHRTVTAEQAFQAGEEFAKRGD